MVTFEKETIKYITAEKKTVTSIDDKSYYITFESNEWSFLTPTKLDEPRDSIKIPILQDTYNQLGKDKHRHSNLYPPKVIISSLHNKQQNGLKKTSFKAEI